MSWSIDFNACDIFIRKNIQSRSSPSRGEAFSGNISSKYSSSLTLFLSTGSFISFKTGEYLLSEEIDKA